MTPAPCCSPTTSCAKGRRRRLGTQPYSREGSLPGDDEVGLTPFVHQPGIGLDPHPDTLLGQQPEDRQPALPCLHHWGREKTEAARRRSAGRSGVQVCHTCGTTQSIPLHPCCGGRRHRTQPARDAVWLRGVPVQGDQLPVQISPRKPSPQPLQTPDKCPNSSSSARAAPASPPWTRHSPDGLPQAAPLGTHFSHGSLRSTSCQLRAQTGTRTPSYTAPSPCTPG